MAPPTRVEQITILRFIAEFLSEYGFSPTLREIAKGVGLASGASIYYRLKAMADDGLIHKVPLANRTIRITGKGLDYLNDTH